MGKQKKLKQQRKIRAAQARRSKGKFGQSALGSDDEAQFQHLKQPKSLRFDLPDSDEGSSGDDDLFSDDEVNRYHREADRSLKKESNRYLRMAGGHEDDSDDDDDELDAEGVMDIEEETSEEEDHYDEEDEEDEFKVDPRTMKMLKKHQLEQEMGSDMEDAEDEKYLPSSQAWGRDKKVYHDTDYVDLDSYSSKRKRLEVARARDEEEEARAIQQRLLEEMEGDNDGLAASWLGLDQLPAKTQEQDEEIEILGKGDENEVEKIELAIKEMNHKAKMKLLKKQSPEFPALVADFSKYMEKEYLERLLPVIEWMNHAQKYQHDSKDDPVLIQYVKTKFHLIHTYATYIAFYMYLKAERASTKDHPVIDTLLKFKKLLNEIDQFSTENGLGEKLSSLLEKINSDPQADLQFSDAEMGEDVISDPKAKKLLTKINENYQNELAKKKVRFAAELAESDDEPTKIAEKPSKKAVELSKKPSQEAKSTDEVKHDTLMQKLVANALSTGEEAQKSLEEKRKITKEIEKNRGLTPNRNKKLKNPRVKHRLKYKDAKHRRRSQVKEPRKELKKYDGEYHGIRTNVHRGMKITR